jgi:hypothetical protein
MNKPMTQADIDKAIEEIDEIVSKKLLAIEQEPVAWRKKVNGVWHYFDESTPFPFDDCEPLYEKN